MSYSVLPRIAHNTLNVVLYNINITSLYYTQNFVFPLYITIYPSNILTFYCYRKIVNYCSQDIFLWRTSFLWKMWRFYDFVVINDCVWVQKTVQWTQHYQLNKSSSWKTIIATVPASFPSIISIHFPPCKHHIAIIFCSRWKKWKHMPLEAFFHLMGSSCNITKL